MNNKIDINGTIEGVTSSSLWGWVLGAGVDEGKSIELVCEFNDGTSVLSGDTTIRNDIRGLHCGFKFVFPPHIASLDKDKFFATYIGVSARLKDESKDKSYLTTHSSALKSIAMDNWYNIDSKVRERSIALLIRTHLTNKKSHALANKLNGLTGVDLFGCVDETAGAVSFGNFKKLSHSRSRLREQGLEAFSAVNCFWHCGDLPFYSALLDAPKYDFYLMVEYDVDFTDNGMAWFQDLINKIKEPVYPPIDYFSPRINKPGDSWYWTSHARQHYKSDSDVVRFGVFPIVGLSRSAVLYLYNQRIRESEALSNKWRNENELPNTQHFRFCEYFVPMEIYKSGLFRTETADSLNMDIGSNIFGDYTVALPILHNTFEAARSAINHPVLEWVQFSNKLLDFISRNSSASDWERVKRSVDCVPTEFRDSDVINQFYTRLKSVINK